MSFFVPLKIRSWSDKKEYILSLDDTQQLGVFKEKCYGMAVVTGLCLCGRCRTFSVLRRKYILMSAECF